jgi:ABC-type multidrug transport system ATPase subunit
VASRYTAGLCRAESLSFEGKCHTTRHNLDAVSRVDVWEMLAKIQREKQLTILLTTHYMEEADRLCDRIAIVDHGRLVTLDTPPNLKASVPGATDSTSLNDVFVYYTGRGLRDQVSAMTSLPQGNSD